MITLTQLQKFCLPIVVQLVPAWCPPSFVFAHVRIESGWDPDVVSTDGYGSIGLMQLLPSTAVEVGVPYDQRMPYNSLLAGIRYMNACKKYLASHGIADYRPEAYNVGVSGYVKGRRNPNYRMKWAKAQQDYAFIDVMRK